MTLEDDIRSLIDDPTSYIKQLAPEECDYILELGVRPGDETPTGDMVRRLDAFRRFVREVEGTIRSPISVHMDNTTIYIGDQLLSESSAEILSPYTLMDLNTLCQNLILQDYVFHLPNEHVDDAEINERLGEPVLIPLPDYENDPPLIGALNSIWRQAKRLREVSYPSEEEDLNAMESAWQQVLGEDIDLKRVRQRSATTPVEDTSSTPAERSEEQMGLFDLVLGFLNFLDRRVRSSRSEPSEEYLEAIELNLPPDIPQSRDNTELARDGVGSDSPLVTREMLNFIQNVYEQVARPSEVRSYVNSANARAAFNMLVANAIGLPYSPSIVRVPFISHMLSNGLIAQDNLRDVATIQSAIGPTRAGFEDNALLPTITIQLPVFLSVLLHRTRSLEDSWMQLAEMRAEATAYRRRRVELLHELQHGSRHAAERIRAALLEDVARWKRTLGWQFASAGTLAVTSTTLGGGLAATILSSVAAALFAGQLDAEGRSALARKLRAHEWYLANLGFSARACMDSLARIESLWGVPLSTSFRAQMDRLSHIRS
jgi:hypothetical protein